MYTEGGVYVGAVDGVGSAAYDGVYGVAVSCVTYVVVVDIDACFFIVWSIGAI